MPDERVLRTAAAVRQSGADWGLLTTVDAVVYASGHAPAIEAGPSPFAGGLTLVVVSADGSVAVVCNELEAAAAAAGWADEVRTYESLHWNDLSPFAEKAGATASRLFADLGVAGTVAVQTGSFPWQLHEALPSGTQLVPIDDQLRDARATKTELEVAALRRCAAVTATGQREALVAVRPGRTELEAFADIRCAMESDVGERLPVTGDLISGVARTAAAMGWPGSRRLEPGDPVISDLAPRVAGYWGDSCNTFVLGEPSRAFERLWDASKRGLDLACEILRPGLTAGEFDASVRAAVERDGLVNPLHIGHGIGTSSYEHPRLVPGNPAELRAGMVLMVEPGACDPDIGGVRLEWMFLITEHGCEVLSPFEHTIAPPTGARGVQGRNTKEEEKA